MREHKRRTRTAARDQVLIPALVGALKSVGLQLRAQDDSKWNPEALDPACEIVGRMLTALRIKAPSAGDTSGLRGGEAGEGRLRKEIKLAWRALDK